MTIFIVFFFNDSATTEISTLSLHDALPIYVDAGRFDGAAFFRASNAPGAPTVGFIQAGVRDPAKLFPPIAHESTRSEEHTSELQSRQYLVCRLLLEKKKQQHI